MGFHSFLRKKGLSGPCHIHLSQGLDQARVPGLGSHARFPVTDPSSSITRVTKIGVHFCQPLMVTPGPECLRGATPSLDFPLHFPGSQLCGFNFSPSYGTEFV